MSRYIRVILYSLPLLLAVYLILVNLDIQGRRQAVYRFGSDSPSISRLFPANRLATVGSDSQQMISEPVYFTVRYPQVYSQARVDIAYTNEGQDLFQIGLKQFGGDDWQYDLQPIENSSLDQLTWPSLVSGDTTLWQRQKKFSTINDFLQQYYELPVAAYNYDLYKRFLISDYQSAPTTSSVDRLLRGSMSIMTYIKNEPLAWDFSVIDFNRTNGPDPVTVVVKDWQGQSIYEQTLADDGRVTDRVGASPVRHLSFHLNSLPEGVYTIEWQAENDIFVSAIATRQKLFGFVDRLYLVNNAEYRDGLPNLELSSTTVFSTAQIIGAQTAHPLGLQTLMIDGSPLDLKQIHEDYFVTARKPLTTIETPINDVLLHGDGLFFVGEEHIFNPEILKLKTFDPKVNVDYVIAGYRVPQVDDQGMHHASITFDLASAGIEQGNLRFMLSAPNLVAQGNKIVIHSITVTLMKPPITSYSQGLQSLLKLFNHD